MTHRSRNRIFAISGVVFLLAVAGILYNFYRTTPEASSLQAVKNAWSSLTRVGAYRFSTTVTQTTYLAPSVTNVGHTSQKEIYHISGNTDLNQKTMLMSLWQNEGSLLSQKDGIEIKIENDQAEGRSIGGDWQPIDKNVVNSFAPGNDALSFLAAARNVKRVGSDLITLADADGAPASLNVTHYSFDIDSNRFALYMRDQMTKELQRSGQLPIDMQLGLSDEYRSMAADGSLWVSSAGYPLRLQLNMRLPQSADGQHIEALIETDFIQPTTEQLLAMQNPAQRLVGWLGINLTSIDFHDGLAQGAICALVAALALLVCLGGNRKVTYPITAGLVIITMLVTPVWSGAKAQAFSQTINAQQAEQKSAQEANQKAQDQARELVTSDWDPHHDPAADQAPLEAVEALPGADASTVAGLQNLDHILQSQPAADDESVDSDQDGLTDDYEAQYGDGVLDPHKVDTDDDGVSDGQEIKLALFPGQSDSDHDGISDGVEVLPFDYRDQKWYTDPSNNDTDKDGNSDGAECPQRLSSATNPAAGICRDTDHDGIPDVFDSDDDNDGVPTYVDESPYTYAATPRVYDQSHPFQLTLSNLAADKPVFITYQLQPTNLKHLTYTMNVLDWPSDDTEGQIQRISDDTYADAANMTNDELENDPGADNGDMRLVPMVEIRFAAGSALPLPLTDTLRFELSDTDYTATFSLQGKNNAGQSSTTLTLLDAPTTQYPFYLKEGGCTGDGSMVSLGKLAKDSTHDFARPLKDFADSKVSFVIHDQADQKEIACVTVPAAAHGSLSDQVVDSSLLSAYGAFARNDADNSVLIYSPLSLVYDFEGSTPVAFSMKVPYINRGGALNANTQSLRVVWTVNMLTDVCNPIAPDYDESKDGVWCDADHPERWTKDVARVVQTYPDSFTVTGLSVTEENGTDMLAILEDPAHDDDATFDDHLWGLAQGLENSYLTGRTTTVDGQDVRDMTLTEIQNRFSQDHNSSIPSDDSRLWSLPKDAFIVRDYHYDNSDGFAQFSAQGASALLNTTYSSGAYPEAVTMLFARDQRQRSVSLDDNASGCSTGVCSLDFDGQSVFTDAVLNWAPYRHTDSGWVSMPSEEYLDLFEARLRSLPEYTPVDATDDARAEVDGQVFMARFFYQSLLNGVAELVAINGTPVVNSPAALDDSHIFDAYYRLNTKAQIVTKVVKTLTESLYNGLAANPALKTALLSGTKGEAAASFFKAIGKGLAQKLEKINSLLGSTFKKVIGGVVGVVAVVAVAASLILYLMDSDSIAGRIGGRIVFGAIGLVTAALAVASLVEAVGWMRTTKQVTNASSKAALVGAIIGTVINWGVFIAEWVISKAAIFSLAFNNMLADAIAATCTVILLAAISCTGIGAIVVAIIGLIDGLIATICAAAGVNELSEDHWARQYVCIGISGWITKIFKWMYYSNTYLVDYSNDKRLSFVSLDQDLRDPAAGMSAGNAMSVSIGVKNTIKLSSIPIDWKAAIYFWQYSASNAKSSAFDYSITPTDTNLDSGLNRGDTSGWTSAGHNTWTKTFDAKTNGSSINLPAPGINRDPTAVLNEGSAIPVQECWAIPTFWGLLPICYIRTERNSIHVPVSASLTVDVLPASLDDFYALTPDGKGYTLAWGRDADLTFSTLRDADGDGLLSKAFTGGNDPNDLEFDTDNDGLSDRFEVANGLNPQDYDSDHDNVYDSVELQNNTDPLHKDSDGDGLPDDQELAGWLFTYGFQADGTPLETMVYPDPNNPDADQDGLTDLMEKIYGFNPNSPDAASVLDYSLSTLELDSPLILLGFDETGGATAYTDSSNFGYGAVCEGSHCPISGFAGRVGNAIHMLDDPEDGQPADPLSLPTSARTISLAGNRHFTLSAWVNPAETDGVIFAKWNPDPGSSQELIFSLVDGYPSLTGGTGAAVTAAQSVPTGQWSHVAVSFDGVHAAFYINGDPVGCAGNCSWSNNPTFAADYTPAPITIGGAPDSLLPPYQGYLDEVALFTRVLTPAEIHDRLTPANYNFNDNVVRPGEEVTYQSQVSNLLNSRFAYGTLNTSIEPQDAIVDADSILAPETFVLYPDNPVVTGVNTYASAKTVEIAPDAASGSLSITQNVLASVVDRRTESNLAELWLKFDEGTGAGQFEDSSGNMPLRSVACASGCPSSGQEGIFNAAITYGSGMNALTLPTLTRMNMVNHGYTISLWVKPAGNPASGTELVLLNSAGSRFKLALNWDSGSTSYTPALTLNGSLVNLSAVGSNRQIHPGSWANLVVQYTSEPQTLNLYLNGTVIGTTTTAGAISADTTLLLGGSSSTGGYSIDDLRIFSRPLGSLDINRLAERPVLVLSMDDSNFTDSSEYNQSVSFPIHKPAGSSNGVRGSSMNPGNDSNSGFAKVGANSMLDLSEGSFTISTWVYPTANTSSAWQGVWGYRTNLEEDGGTTGKNAYPTLERKGKQLRFLYGSGSTYETLTPVDALTENQWNHVVVTFAPNTTTGKFEMKLYVNAEVKASKLFDVAPGANTDANGFYVGADSGTSEIEVKTIHMDDEHDGGSHAEVYLNQTIGSSTNQIYYQGSVSDGTVLQLNKHISTTSFQSLAAAVWEDDGGGNDDDFCGSTSRYWYNNPDTSDQSVNLSDGFDGTMYYQYHRASLTFTGQIDEMQVYRYPLDSDQVFDLYSSSMLTANLPLDDRPATTSFNNNAGVETDDNGNCAPGQCPTAGAAGLINQAVRFDGLDDRINVAVQTTSDYMLSLWINTTCPNCGLYHLSSNSTLLNQLYLRSGNICALTGSVETCSRGGSVADGQWHHLAYLYNSSTAALYLDGTKVNSLPASGAMAAAPTGQAVIGSASAAAHEYYSGLVDDVRIYRVGQGEAHIADLLARAPLFLAHLDESDPAAGMQDATLADWTLSCDSAGDACPQGDLEGRLKKAVEFDGVNDALRLDQSALSSTATSFSLGLWVMPTDLSSAPQTLWALTDAQGHLKYAVSIAADSMRLCLQSAGTPACTASSSVDLIQNVWNYVTLVVTRASGTQENYALYINGYQDSTGSGNTGANVTTGLGGLTLGNVPTGLTGGPYRGKLDEAVLYTGALTEIDIRDIFNYQMASVEESSTLNLTIDADAPTIDLLSYPADFPYMNGSDRMLQVNASDATSGVARVEMDVNHSGADTYQAAPVCTDSGSNTAFCPTFVPGTDGKYLLSFRAVDRVGASTSTAQYAFYVDNQGPAIMLTQQEGQLIPAELHPTLENTWMVSLDGSITDRLLGDGSAGSGVDLDSLQVTLYSEAGEIVGAGSQKPVIAGNGSTWSLDYLIPEKEPTGQLSVVVEAKDRVGNPTRTEIHVLLDASAARSTLGPDGLPQLSADSLSAQSDSQSEIYTGGTLSGSASDLPSQNAPYMTSDGEAARTDIAQVQVGFTPSLSNTSFLFNQPYPDETLAWLPLDNADLPTGDDGQPDPDATTRYFVDISPYQLEGVCDGSACPAEGIQGHVAGSMYFDGQNRSINLGHTVDLTQRSFTLSSWVKLEAVDRNNPILWQGPASIPQERILFGLNAENHFVCGFGASDLVTPAAYADQGWHAWACTFDQESGARKIYRDGQEVAADTATAVPEMSENLYVGAAPAGSLDGYLDELLITGRSMDAAQVRSLYTGYQAVFQLGVDRLFLTGGDVLAEDSGFFGTAALSTGDDDTNNKVGAGQVGDYSLDLDGNDLLRVSPGYQLQLDRGAFSLAAWVNPQATGSDRDVISRRDENPELRYPTLSLAADGAVKLGFGDGYQWLGVQSNPGLVPDGAWSHLLVSFDGDLLRLYVNGRLAQTWDDLAGKMPYAADRFNVGDGFKGRLDDVRVYPRALDALEVQALADEGWLTASLTQSGDQTTWSVDAPGGLEGPYRIDTRAWDSLGHYDVGDDVNNQWSGVVDTLAPRLTLTREIHADDDHLATYTFIIEDTMLDESSVRMNICDQVTLNREYLNSPWYLTNGVAVNSSVYRITGSCVGTTLTTVETGVWACDQGGNCSAQTFPPELPFHLYLPWLAGPQGPANPAGEAPKIPDALRELALSWPPMSIAASGDPTGPGPQVELADDTIDSGNQRNPFQLNLQGWASDPDGVRQVEIQIYQGDSLVYSAPAALVGDLWNAMWFHPLGEPPADGVYRLVVTATDNAGVQTTFTHDLRVDLRP